MAKKFPFWATDNVTDIGNGDPSIDDPGVVKQALGWVIEKPLVQTMNWILNLLGHFVTANNKIEGVVSAYQTEVGQRVEVDNSIAVATVLLPESPLDGQWVEVSPKALTSTYMVTVLGGTKDIMILNDKSCELNIVRAAFKFWWDESNNMWKIRLVNSIGDIL